MEFVLQTLAILSSGICLSMGAISLFTALGKGGQKIDLVFAIMSLCIFLYFLIPPVGFVLNDKAPYPATVLFKRVFNFSYVSLLPWFIFYYTGYKKKLLPILMDALYLIAYLTMFFTTKDSMSPLWMLGVSLSMGLVPVHSWLAIRYQYKSGEKQKANWLVVIMILYLFIYIPTILNHVTDNYFGKLFHAKLFYPNNLFPVAFILYMGIRLRSNLREKIGLENLLIVQNLRWDAIMKNMRVIMVQFDMQGRIIYINPYGIKFLGFQHASEVVGKFWSLFLPSDVSENLLIRLKQLTEEADIPQEYKTDIINAKREKRTFNWNNLALKNDKGELDSVFSIGTDITDLELYILQIQDLKSALEKENLMLKGEPPADGMDAEIIGTSEAIKYVIHKARQVASTSAAVLLEGETGVGKELFADLIHQHSLRSELPFVKINCGAMPAELMEDELFGHEKGAFTGAIQVRKGRFEIANGGTIFLDEIGELPLALQPKLLRVLQTGSFERVGGQQTLQVDVRVIAATNRILAKEVREGRFRDDLFYRLNVFPITIPPLRNRPEDLPLLIQYFIDKKNKKHSKSIQFVSKSDMNWLLHYDWPGNIRELRNVIERAVISSSGDTPVSYTHLRAHETDSYLVCRLL